MRSYPSYPNGAMQAMTRRAAISVLAASLLFGAGCKKDPAPGEGTDDKAKAIASKQGLTAEGNPNPTSDDRCPMCAMRVADHAHWAGAIELANGDTYYTCSVRCTLATSMNPEPFLGVPHSEIKRVRVPQYLEKGKWLDADAALYVIDSDIRGPMGLSLVPAATEEEAKVIVRRHKGRVLTRDEVTMPVLKDLKGRSKM